MLSNHHRAKSCFFHLGYDTRKITYLSDAISKGALILSEQALTTTKAQLLSLKV